jgi:hypothetical protein
MVLTAKDSHRNNAVGRLGNRGVAAASYFVTVELRKGLRWLGGEKLCAPMEPLARRLLPLLGELLLRDGLRRAKLLGEQRDAPFLEQPAVTLERLVANAARVVSERHVLLPEGRDLGSAFAILGGMLAETRRPRWSRISSHGAPADADGAGKNRVAAW